jgi:hypothetical protein
MPFPERGEGHLPMWTVIWATVDMIAATRNPGELLAMAAGLPAATIVFYLNAHRYLLDEIVAQGCSNLRDYFKEN